MAVVGTAIGAPSAEAEATPGAIFMSGLGYVQGLNYAGHQGYRVLGKRSAQPQPYRGDGPPKTTVPPPPPPPPPSSNGYGK